ncbi:MAG: hypothetical protein K0S08_1399 [Gammaproteobacteria bacterium]|jgi:hypothetical protein|nr:hypothetical protein [Gammaproteobacteria bacterium]
MGRNEKKAYVEVIRQCYLKADKVKKGTILGEFCETLGYNRKYAIRLLNKKPKRRKPKPRKGHPRYDKANLLAPLKTIWAATNYMGSKKLKVAILE